MDKTAIVNTIAPLVGLLLWEAWLGATKRVEANSTLGLVVSAVKLIAKAFAGKAGPAVLLLLFLPSCGHAAAAARGTFATVAAAEHSYSRWAVGEVERLTKEAQATCPKEADRAACVDRITSPTFRKLEITDAALTSYHEAQRAAAKCLASGGEVLACTVAVAGAAGKLLEQLDGLGFKVLQ